MTKQERGRIRGDDTLAWSLKDKQSGVGVAGTLSIFAQGQRREGSVGLGALSGLLWLGH